ncbi:MAG: sulfur carrier protein ThiS [Planctomycetes bacterium]|nr:sulfur carrier protein ThiS [Planctomycetota bacterium]
MKLVINGETAEAPDGTAVTELLKLRRVSQPDMVTVELNGEILDRKTFDKTFLREGDRVEFLYFMGGG